MNEEIYFYYTNDLHSHFDHWAQVATFMKDKSQMRTRANDSFWLLDIGDHIDRVNPITEATMGRANVELLNNLNYDFVTIGNNEGITLPADDFFHLYDDAKFDVICSNLQRTIGPNPPWLLKSKIVESVQGVKIGLLGLTARFNPYYHRLDWDAGSLHVAIDEQLRQLDEKVEIIVLLSHVGINEDKLIAEKYPEIDVIIGSHTHHLIETGEMVGQTLLTAGGKLCAHVGEVILTWNFNEKKLIHKTATTTDIKIFPRDPQTKNRLAELQEAADVILDKKIIHTKKTIESDWFRETKLMRNLTEEFLEFTGADIAMLNAGLILRNFRAGDITYRDVHKNCPHPINACIVTLSGDELLEVVRMCLTTDFINLALQGFGFRGKVIGKMIYAGLDVKIGNHANGEQYVEGIYFQNKRVDSNKTYRIAVADTFTFGRLLPEIAKSPTKELMLPEFIRDLLVRTLLKYNRDTNRP